MTRATAPGPRPDITPKRADPRVRSLRLCSAGLFFPVCFDWVGFLNGAATTGLFARHFSEMRCSAQYKDLVLGNSDNEIGDIGTVPILGTGNDTASPSGEREDYSVVAIDINGNQVADLVNDYASVIRIDLSDNGGATQSDLGPVDHLPSDGTDLQGKTGRYCTDLVTPADLPDRRSAPYCARGVPPALPTGSDCAQVRILTADKC